MTDNADTPPEPEPLRTVQQLWDAYIAGKRARKGFARYDETKASKDAFFAGAREVLRTIDAVMILGADPRAVEDWVNAVARELDHSGIVTVMSTPDGGFDWPGFTAGVGGRS